LAETSQAAIVRNGDLTITIPAVAGEPLRFAAGELQRYLLRMTASRVPVRVAEMARHRLLLGAGAAHSIEPSGADEFVIEPSQGGAEIRGGSARAALHGVYALLEQLGCRWSLHGRSEEVVPQGVDFQRIRRQQVSPRFDVRGYSADIMTWHYGDRAQLAEHLAADYEFIDWMGKSGGNAFLLIRHPFDSQLTIRELLPEFGCRGIDVEYGGHVIPLLLPRDLFSERPELFPATTDGKRSEFGNLCTANPEAVRVASDNAVRYVREYPELRTLHIWGADLWGGGWCHCRDCLGASPQDQSLRLCNAVARALGEQGIPRPVCYLAYHDTLAPDLKERPAPNVFVEFAPRERCYGHPINDRSCTTNGRYRAALERHLDLFGGRVRIFEYYADAILFCGCAVPLAEVIAADLDYYHGLGIREITNLQFGSFSLWAYPLNFLVYAAATRAEGCRIAPLREDYARRFGRGTKMMAATFAELEAVMATVVTYADIRRPPKRLEAIENLRPRVDRAIDRLGDLSARLEPMVMDGAVNAWKALLSYNRAVLSGVRHELDGSSGQPQYEAALEIMRRIERRFTGLWGAVNLPVIHAYYSAPLHLL
jgi:Domain of unknown function (DUF4838)